MTCRSALVLLLASVAGYDTAHAQGDAVGKAQRFLLGCERTTVAGGAQFKCDGLLASISEFPGISVEAAQASQVAGIRAAIQGELTTAGTSFASGGKTWPALRLAVRRKGEAANSFEALLLAFETPEKSARLAFCGASMTRPGRAQRCNELLPLLAELGPGPLTGPPPAPTFLGKKLVLPEGCTTVDASDAGFRVACGETASLASMKLNRPDDMPKIVRTLGEQLMKAIPGAVEEKERACKIGGAATRCRVIAVGEGAGRAILVLGSALVGETPVFVQCGQLASQRRVHPVCAACIAF
jgi:hypothetical protein